MVSRITKNLLLTQASIYFIVAFASIQNEIGGFYVITIQIDPTIHSKQVKELAGALVLALLGELEEDDQPIPVEVLKQVELSPEAAFLPNVPNPPPISTVGPHLVIPNPPPPAIVAPVAAPPAIVAPVAAQPAMTASLGTTVASPSGAPPAAPATIQLDSKGLPWDSRIHASSKGQNGDGTWRGKRGVDDALIAGVEAELRKLMAIPAPPSPMPALTPGAMIPPPPPVAPAPAAPTADAQAEYVALVMQVAALIGQNKINNDQLQRCFAAVGITQMQDLGIRLDLLPTLRGMIDGIVAGQNA